MAELLTLAEMEERFPSEWILIDQPQTDQDHQVLRGIVLFHSKDRDAVYEAAIAVPAPKRIAIHYSGRPPAGMEFAL